MGQCTVSVKNSKHTEANCELGAVGGTEEIKGSFKNLNLEEGFFFLILYWRIYKINTKDKIKKEGQ